MANTAYSSWNTNRVVQVVQGTYTTAGQLNTGSSLVDTGITATITPTSTSSKILVLVTVSCSYVGGAYYNRILLLRDAVSLLVGDAAGSRSTGTMSTADTVGSAGARTMPFSYLDSPATTSAIVYKLQSAATFAGGDSYLNRGTTDTDSTSFGRSMCNIILVEVL